MARFSRISAMVWGRVNVCIPFLYHTIWGMSRGGFLVLLYNFQHFLLKFRARLIYDTYDTYDIADRYVTSEIFNQFFYFFFLVFNDNGTDILEVTYLSAMSYVS